MVQTAPAVRVAIAETLGLPPGAISAGQMVTGLRKLGFDYVFGKLQAAVWHACVVLLTAAVRMCALSRACNTCMCASCVGQLYGAAAGWSASLGMRAWSSLATFACVHTPACLQSALHALVEHSHLRCLICCMLPFLFLNAPADTLFGADLTIMEEGTELLHRLEAKAAEQAGKPLAAENGHEPSSILPMFTSCCPGWVSVRDTAGS